MPLFSVPYPAIMDAIMPICHGGAELGDPEMKHGNISVLSKNIAINDSARFQ